MQINRASDYLYMHMQTISLATLANLVFQIMGPCWAGFDSVVFDSTRLRSTYCACHHV